MTVDQDEVPDAIAQVWREWLRRSADKALQQTMLTLPPERRRGFRDGKWPRETAIDRLLSEATLTPAIRSLLQGASPARALTAVLSEEALTHAESRLVQVLGRASLAATLLIDEREPLRARGRELASLTQSPDADTARPVDPSSESTAPDSPDPQALAAAISALRDDFRPFLEMLGYTANREANAHPGTAIAALPASAPAERTHAATIASLQTQLKLARQAEAKATRDIKALESQKRDLAANLTRSEQRLATGIEALRTLEVAHARLKETVETSIESGIEDRVNERLYPWLASAEALDAAARGSATAPLLERASTTLARQAAVDRRYGVWSRLHAEREALRAVLVETRSAERESLRPLPELATLQTELQTRIEELETLLGIGTAGERPDGPLVAIRRRLGESPSIDQLAIVHAGVRAAADLGVLSGQMLSDAYGLVNATFQRRYDESARQRGAPRREAVPARTPFMALRNSLEAHTACTLLIDGHNCLFALRELLDLPFHEDRPGAGACQHFANRLVPLVRQHRNLIVHLWFDSDTAATERVEDNLRVLYSGGVGRDRADQGIIDYLHSRTHAAERGTTRCFVVTADRAEAAEVEATGARVIAPEEFVSLLS